jgi:Flp pilus assembly pilin Flp
MNRFTQSIRRIQGHSLTLLRDTRGLSTVEYVIILVLVAVLAIGTWRTFGSSVKTKITESTTAVDGLSATDGKTKGSN